MVRRTDQICPMVLLRHVKLLSLVSVIQESLLIFVKPYNE
jgi:hypothetical protein